MSTDAREAGNAVHCRWCGKYHGTLCPDVKAIEYHPDGTVKRVEFKSVADYFAPVPTLPNFGPYEIT